MYEVLYNFLKISLTNFFKINFVLFFIADGQFLFSQKEYNYQLPCDLNWQNTSYLPKLYKYPESRSINNITCVLESTNITWRNLVKLSYMPLSISLINSNSLCSDIEVRYTLICTRTFIGLGQQQSAQTLVKFQFLNTYTNELCNTNKVLKNIPEMVRIYSGISDLLSILTAQQNECHSDIDSVNVTYDGKGSHFAYLLTHQKKFIGLKVKNWEMLQGNKSTLLVKYSNKTMPVELEIFPINQHGPKSFGFHDKGQLIKKTFHMDGDNNEKMIMLGATDADK